jgi:hypothetical protein
LSNRQDFPFVIVATSEQITNRERSLVSITVVSSNLTDRCRADMSVRGSSSAKHPKKPYRLELQDENGDDLKLSLLGMPKESDWVLYPAYLDKSMIRDVLVYEVWRQMGYWPPAPATSTSLLILIRPRSRRRFPTRCSP